MSQTSGTLPTSDGALRLWSEIVRGLRSAGYKQAVPEYLKLSRMLSQTRMTELVKGQPESAQWTQLRELAREALESLGPLAEAARILAEMPSVLQLSEAEPMAAATIEALPVTITETATAIDLVQGEGLQPTMATATTEQVATAKVRRKKPKQTSKREPGHKKARKVAKQKVEEEALSGQES
jgi:hypothetical protein